MTINSKTKKSDLVNEVVSMGLLSEQEANAKTQKELYTMYKENSKNDEVKVETTVEETKTDSNVILMEKVTSKKKLPKKNNKQKEDNKCVTTLGEKMADLIISTGETKESILGKMGMSVSEFENQKDIEISDTPKTEEAEQPKSEIVENGDNEPLQQTDKVEESEQPITTESVVNEVNPINPEEENLKNSIIGQMIAMSENIKELENRYNSMESSYKELAFRFGNAYRNIVKVINAIALAKDVKMCGYYDMLVENVKAFKGCEHYDEIEIIDMHKLILEDIERANKVEQIEKAKQKQKELEIAESHVYRDGVHVSYIDGEVVKTKGISKKLYNEYLGWIEDVIDWVDYIVEEMETINKNVNLKKRAVLIKELKKTMNEWYDEWEAEDCVDDSTLDLVKETVNNLIEDNDREKAMSDFVAIVDSLEL